MTQIPKVSTTSAPIANEELEKLRSIFPQFVKDGDIDFDALKGWFEKERLSSSYEKFGLRWAGKQIAYDAIRIPSVGTLTPHPEESVDWEKTQNIFIEGDNLEVLKLLQKHYREQVKMIYIDPPYNTGKDFVYKDNFTEDRSDYYERTGQTKEGIKMVTNAESNGRYHSDWLTMMYPRLFLAKNLLREDGVIFISIDDNEVHHLRMIMDEIFGEENFLAQLIWHNKRGGGNDAKFAAIEHEYVIFYAKNKETLDKLFFAHSEDYLERYNEEDTKGKFFWDTFKRKSGKQYYSITCPDGSVLSKDEQGSPLSWLRSEARFKKDLSEGEVRFAQTRAGWSVQFKQRIPVGKKPRSIITDFGTTSSGNKELIDIFGNDKIFSNPKPSELVGHFIDFTTGDGDIVLDFFAGSGTTAHAVMDLNAQDGGNRRYICVQLPEATGEDSEARKAGYQTIADIARERIRRAGAKIAKGDVGFKSCHLAPSAYRQWHPMLSDETTPEKYLEQQKLFVERPLIDGYDPKTVVYEIALKEGCDLHSTVSQEMIGSISCWTVRGDDHRIIISFADTLGYKDIESLRMIRERDLFVCLDSALTDTVKINILRNWQVKTI